MIEKIVMDYLDSKMEVPVHTEVPESPPAKYVLIEKTGSSESNFLHSATLAIQSVAESLHNAAVLNEMVKEAMGGITELDEITRAKLASDYNFTNTATKKYRYQAVYDLVHY